MQSETLVDLLSPGSISVVVNIADGRPKARYILAVDDSKNMLEEIVKVISENLGTRKIQHVSKEDALLNKDLSVRGAILTHHSMTQ